MKQNPENFMKVEEAVQKKNSNEKLFILGKLGESLENMSMDIDALVEGVYRDRMDRKNFHRQFIQYGLMLYLLVMLIQYLIQVDTYRQLLKEPLILVALHTIVLLNSYFLVNGEKYYNENVGAE